MSINALCDRPVVRRLTAALFIVLMTAPIARTQTTPGSQGGTAKVRCAVGENLLESDRARKQTRRDRRFES